MEQFQTYMKQLEQELSKYTLFKQAEEKTGIPKTYLVIALLFVLFGCVVFNIAAGFVINLIGFAYPAFASFKMIESPNKTDVPQWVTYWVIFGFCVLLESFEDILLQWFPFYFLFKLGAFVYLMLPQTQGAAVVYTKMIKPLFATSPTKSK